MLGEDLGTHPMRCEHIATHTDFRPLSSIPGVLVDMGTGFDVMTELSQPRLEAQHLANGALTPAQLRNRELLRRAMAAGGFNGIDNEWWHFDMLDRAHVRQTFVRVE